MAQKKTPGNQNKQQAKSPDIIAPVVAPEKTSLVAEPFIPPLDKLNNWFRLHISWVLCILIVCWAGVRISYFNSIVKSPLYSYYSAPESDNRFFDDWAKDLNKDWLNAKPIHPYHHWHKLYADYYFQKHPEKLKEILAEHPGADSSFNPATALWNEWYRGNRYHQEPLYPYTLAVLYYFHFDEVRAMIILQLILGVLSGVLLFFITRRYFGETAAVLTGVLYFLCGVLMYNEVILLRTSWTVFLTVLLVFIVDKTVSNPKPLILFLCGISIGVAFLMQSTFLLYLIGVLVIMFFVHKQRLTNYLKNAGLLIAGFVIIFLPVILRNITVGAPTFSTSSVGVADIVASNVYGTKSISTWAPSPSRETEILGEYYNNITDAIVATLKTHPSVISYCSLEWQKLIAACGGIEYPNNENYYFYQQYIPALSFTTIDFFLLGPLGLAGLIFCFYHRKKYYALYLAIIIQFVTFLIIFVLARFRAPLVILSIPLAAYALVECANFWTGKRPITFAKIGLVAILIVLSFAGYSSKTKEGNITDSNYAILFATHFNDKLEEYKNKKQWSEWLALQKQFMDMKPVYIGNMNQGEISDDLNQVHIMQFFDYMYTQRNDVYDSLHDKDNAAGVLDTVKKLDLVIANSLKRLNMPVENADSINYISLAHTFKNKGQYDSAIFYFKKTLALNVKNTEVQKDLGNLYLDKQNFDSAQVYFKSILTLAPDDADAVNGMGCIYFIRKDYPRAMDEYKKSVALNPKQPQPYSNLARTYFVMAQYKNALDAFGKARVLDPQNMDNISLMITSFQKLGKTDSAKKYEAMLGKK